MPWCGVCRPFAEQPAVIPCHRGRPGRGADMLRFRTSKVKKLIELLNHEDPSVRQRAIGDLGRIGDARAVEPLIGALRDEDEHVRNWAARALAAEPDPRAVEPLIGALHDQRVSVREGAHWLSASLTTPVL